MRVKLGIWAATAMVVTALAACGSGDERAEAPEGSAASGETGGAEAEASVLTIEREGTSVIVEPTDGASLFSVTSNRPGKAAVRTGSCESQGKVVADLGEVGVSLLTEVEIPFADLTKGGHVLTIGDSFCAELESE